MRRAGNPSDEAVGKHLYLTHIAKPRITPLLLSLLDSILVTFLCAKCVLPLHLPDSTLLLHGLLILVLMIILSKPCSSGLLLSDFEISEICFEDQGVPGSFFAHELNVVLSIMA